MEKLSDVPKVSPRTRIIIGALIALAVGLVFAGATMAISSPRACASCHEMRPIVDTWSVSPHAQVGCYSCHGTPQPWYGAPLSVAERWSTIPRDMRARQARSASADTSGSVPTTVSPIPDAACLQCHDADRKVTSRYGLVIDHAEHAERNKSCVSCHLWSAHPDPKASRGTLMMSQCFNCHGQASQPKASGECIVCHVKGMDLKPEPHKTGKWQTEHGKAAKEDRQQCVMCHKDEFCDSCHRVEMPHPLGWARGASGHAAVATNDRAACEQCHPGSANLCTMCHHQGYDDRKGPWMTQHNVKVRETGAAFCFKCHEATHCLKCHTSPPVKGVTTQ